MLVIGNLIKIIRHTYKKNIGKIAVIKKMFYEEGFALSDKVLIEFLNGDLLLISRANIIRVR